MRTNPMNGQCISDGNGYHVLHHRPPSDPIQEHALWQKEERSNFRLPKKVSVSKILAYFDKKIQSRQGQCNRRVGVDCRYFG